MRTFTVYFSSATGYGSPSYGFSSYGGYPYGSSSYGYGSSIYGLPSYGANPYRSPVYGSSSYGAPRYGATTPYTSNLGPGAVAPLGNPLFRGTISSLGSTMGASYSSPLGGGALATSGLGYGQMPGAAGALGGPQHAPGPGSTIVPDPAFNPDADCDALHNAVHGLTTDQATIIRILTHRTNDQRQVLRTTYQTKFGKVLQE